MQFSDKTLDILKNFSSINNSLIIRQGTTQRTVSQGKNILAQATTPEDIPRDAPIFDLGKFLGLMSLFDKPDVAFGEKCLKISAGDHEAEILYADPSVIKDESREFKPPPAFMTFTMDAKSLQLMERSAAVLKATDVEISFKKGDLRPKIAALLDTKNVGDQYRFQPSVFTVSDDLESCKLFFKHEYMKLLPGEYEVSLAIKGKIYVAKFENKTTPVVYFLSAEPNYSSVSIGQPATV